ncbi:MAG: HIT family protein [Defluviitaleaceae bacterium]|nr:HIT family protein [Defluviitaleaceae bacterium]
MSADCIFCRIINGSLPSYKIYEDELFVAFFDIYPKCIGHTLIVPKKHCANFYDLPKETASALMPAAQSVARRLRQVLNFDGLNVLQNNGEAAGQTVFHYHLQLIPRYKNDGTFFGWKTVKPSDEEFMQLQEKILKINN